jgi:biopolymer transport protein ExbD
MAQIISTSAKGKANPIIDLTPMVDLGFLLITFFIMTTTMAKPKAMEIQMPYVPAPVDNGTAYYETSALTLIPAQNNLVYYYEGKLDVQKPLLKAASLEVLRNIIKTKQAQLKQRPIIAEQDLQVLIKPAASSNTKLLINVLDEMSINKVAVYALVDITPEEISLIAKY